MFRRITLLAALLLLFPPGIRSEKLNKKLPSLTGLVRHGCAVSGPISMLDRNSEAPRYRDVWRVTLWAAHKGQFDKKATKDWQLLYAYRKTRLQGLMDCEKFMVRLKKAVIKAKERK